MPVAKKTKSSVSYGGGAIASSDVKSYSDDPFIVEKNEEAKIAVSKLTLPETEKK